MKCNNCKSEVEPGSHFCSSCGSPQSDETQCPECENKINKTMKFCSYCGCSLNKTTPQYSTTYSLRKTPITISEKSNYKQKFGLDYNRKPLNYIRKDYCDNNDDTIIDKATGLMWQQSGSNESFDYNIAANYIAALNTSNFQGRSDWRLPTIPELISLMEPLKKNGLFLDPVFDNSQSGCWSSDRASSGMAWGVSFVRCEVGCGSVEYNYYVRAVRSDINRLSNNNI